MWLNLVSISIFAFNVWLSDPWRFCHFGPKLAPPPELTNFQTCLFASLLRLSGTRIKMLSPPPATLLTQSTPSSRCSWPVRSSAKTPRSTTTPSPPSSEDQPGLLTLAKRSTAAHSTWRTSNQNFSEAIKQTWFRLFPMLGTLLQIFALPFSFSLQVNLNCQNVKLHR